MHQLTDNTYTSHPIYQKLEKKEIVYPGIDRNSRCYWLNNNTHRVLVVCFYQWQLHYFKSSSQIKEAIEITLSQVDCCGNVLVSLNVEEMTDISVTLRWYTQLYSILSDYKTQGKLANFTILTSTSYTIFEDEIDDVMESQDRLLPLHWFLCSYSLLYPKILPVKKHKDNVLFLPGKLYGRPHRVGMLYEILSTDKYRNKCMYAYTADQHQRAHTLAESYWDKIHQEVMEFYPGKNITQTQIKELFISNEQDIDGLQTVSKKHGIPIMYPVHEDIYSECSVELIPETWWPNCVRHLTEKTFRALLAGIPFVHANSLQTALLHRLGFDTYIGLVEPGWHIQGWKEISECQYRRDSDWHHQDVLTNTRAAFKLAETMSSNLYHREIVSITNRNQCDKILREYSEKLNELHPGVFTPDMIQQLYSIHGVY